MEVVVVDCNETPCSPATTILSHTQLSPLTFIFKTSSTLFEETIG